MKYLLHDPHAIKLLVHFVFIVTDSIAYFTQNVVYYNYDLVILMNYMPAPTDRQNDVTAANEQ